MRPRLWYALAAIAFLGAGLSGQPSAHSWYASGRVARAAAVVWPPAQSAAAARLDAERLMQDVRALSAPELEGRLTGSSGSRRAQSLILGRYKHLALQTVNGSYEQRFSVNEERHNLKRGVLEATNLLAMIPGRVDRDDFILVTAHYDHLGTRDGQTYHGADDNASGVAAMLAIASWFVMNPPTKSLMFIAFDAEELGLQGSKYFVGNPPIDLKRVSAVVNLDMVARGDKNVLNIAGTSHYPALKEVVADITTGRSIIVTFGHDRPGRPGEDWTQSSDHGSFHAAGIPFLYFGVEDHRDYHKPTDTADKIPKAFYREASEAALETVRRLVERPAIPRRHGALLLRRASPRRTPLHASASAKATARPRRSAPREGGRSRGCLSPRSARVAPSG